MVTSGIFVTLSVGILCFLLDRAQAGDYCWTDTFEYEYCYYGCCDDHSYYYKCCSVTSAIIVGAVIGGIAFIAFIAFIVICACYLYKKKGSRRGTVIYPNTNTVVMTTYPIQYIPGQQYQQASGYYMGQSFPGPSQGAMPTAPYPPHEPSNPVHPPPPAY